MIVLERRTDMENDRHERFLQLMLPLRNRLVHFARAMTRNRDEADDLVSDTILAALERFDNVRGPDAFLSYLFTIATRLYKRQRWRRRLFGAYDERHAEGIEATGGSPDSAADVEALHRALEKLPEQQREAVVLFEISGLSLEEIRGIQGGSISGVKSRVSRGRKELARLLGAVDRSEAQSARVEVVVNEISRTNNSYLIYSGPHSNG